MEFTIAFIELFLWSIYLVGPLLVFLGLVIVALGQIVTRVEKWKLFDGLYWTLITATTVGYGDICPLKKSSKILSALIALLGLIFTGLIVAVALNTTSIALKKHMDPVTLEKVKQQLG